MQFHNRRGADMRRTHIGIVLTLVIGVVAAGYGQARGGGYLIRNAAIVLTMDPSRGDGSILGQLEDADVLMVEDKIAQFIAICSASILAGARPISSPFSSLSRAKRRA